MRIYLTDLRREAIDRALDQEARVIVQCLREDYEGDADDLMDQLHEVVDGHEWVIYTAQAEAIGYGSRFRDAYTEEMGEAPPSLEARAYLALEHHVLDSDEWEALYDERSKPYTTDDGEADQ